VVEFLQRQALTKLADSSHLYTREALDNVLTIASAIEILTGAECTLDRFLEQKF
jgi:hypothetical protein